jgi:hypothetical protein
MPRHPCRLPLPRRYHPPRRGPPPSSQAEQDAGLPVNLLGAPCSEGEDCAGIPGAQCMRTLDTRLGFCGVPCGDLTSCNGLGPSTCMPSHGDAGACVSLCGSTGDAPCADGGPENRPRACVRVGLGGLGEEQRVCLPRAAWTTCTETSCGEGNLCAPTGDDAQAQCGQQCATAETCPTVDTPQGCYPLGDAGVCVPQGNTGLDFACRFHWDCESNHICTPILSANPFCQLPCANTDAGPDHICARLPSGPTVVLRSCSLDNAGDNCGSFSIFKCHPIGPTRGVCLPLDGRLNVADVCTGSQQCLGRSICAPLRAGEPKTCLAVCGPELGCAFGTCVLEAAGWGACR